MRNKFVKLITVSIACGFLMLQSIETKAQFTVGASMATSNSVTNFNTLAGLPSNNITITKVTVSLSSSAGGNATYFFYDWFASFQTNLWQTNIFRYTNRTIVDPFTNAVVFTNSLGRQDTNLYIGRAEFMTNVVATNTTSSVPAIGSISLAPGTVYSIDVNWVMAQGLAVRGTNNSPGGFITIEYK